MKNLFGLACGCLLALSAAGTAQEEVSLIAAGDAASGWTFDYGREFPGAAGGLTAEAAADRDGRGGLKLVGDFRQGGQYVQAGRKIGRVDIRELSLWIRNPDAVRLVIRLNDGSGQTHQFAIQAEATADWQQIVLPLQDFFERRGQADAVTCIARYESWGGAKDGDWHGPATAIYFLLSNPGGKGMHTLWLKDIALRPRPAAAPGADIEQVVALDEVAGGEHAWGFSLGGEFPGAKGSLAVATNEPGAARPCFQLAADFSGGGAYVAAIRNLGELGAKDTVAIRLRVKSATSSVLGLQLVDATGQTHQRSRTPIVADGQWHDLVIKPAEMAGGEHWGGANDGRWHGAAKQVALSIPNQAGNTTKQPVVYLADISAQITRPAFIQPAAFASSFEGLAKLPPDWPATEGIAVDATTAAAGHSSLLLQRAENDLGKPCTITSPLFPAAPGLWSIRLACKSELRSPDNSYRGAVTLEALDAGGQVLDRLTLAELFGTHDWQPVQKRIELPKGATAARFQVRLDKASGRFWVDDLAAAYLAPAPQRDDRIARVLFSTAQLGNLLFPEDPRRVNVTVEARQPLLDRQLAATWTVRDYWGAEQMPPAAATLGPPDKKNKLFVYSATLDLGPAALETGRYYEVHLAIPQADGAPYRDYTSLAILPVADTKRYKPEEVPFTSRCWDNRSADYIKLSDRLGLRVCGIWGGWSATPPYKAEAPTLDLCQQLGLGWLTGTPIHSIEQGKRDYDEAALRQGARNLIEKFSKVRPMTVSLGNEPHGTGEVVRANVAAYRAVYEEIKKVDPTVFVVATAVEPNDEYFRLGYGQWCDAFDFHIYEGAENVRATIGQYRELMKKYGCEKPIWSTELGLNSQGQTRLAVAREVHRKFCAFFAAGGANASWFSILYPDPAGKARGSSGDSHNVFDCRYSRYAPRLDAIAYFNAVNAIAIKKFAGEASYADGIHAFLFRDRDGEALQVLWKDKGRQDVMVPLAGVAGVRAIRIDGSRHALEAASQGITITVTEDPLLLLYRGGPAALATALAAPAAKLLSPPAALARGKTTRLNVESANPVDLQAPPFWTVERISSGFALTPPAASAVREADLTLVLTDASGQRRGELYYHASVTSP